MWEGTVEVTLSNLPLDQKFPVQWAQHRPSRRFLDPPRLQALLPHQVALFICWTLWFSRSASLQTLELQLSATSTSIHPRLALWSPSGLTEDLLHNTCSRF